MKYLTFLVLAITPYVPSALAQSIDISNRGSIPPHPIDLVLNISVKTVETHRMLLTERLDIHDTAGLVRYAIKPGLIRLED